VIGVAASGWLVGDADVGGVVSETCSTDVATGAIPPLTGSVEVECGPSLRWVTASTPPTPIKISDTAATLNHALRRMAGRGLSAEGGTGSCVSARACIAAPHSPTVHVATTPNT
jgi:hypothetical protein